MTRPLARRSAEAAQCAGVVGREDPGSGEAVVDDGVAQGELGDLREVGGDLRQSATVRQGPQRQAAGPDRAAQQPMSGHLRVHPEQPFAHPQRVRVGQAEPDVVGQRTEVGRVVVHPLQLDQHAAQPLHLGGHPDAERGLDGEAVGERVGRRRVAADPFGETGGAERGPALEQLLDPPVHVPQPGLQPDDGLADHGEPEMPRLDQPGVHRPDRDLVHAVPGHREESEVTGRAELRDVAGVRPHRVPVVRPVRVPDQPARPWMAGEPDPVQVHRLPLEPPGRKGQVGQRRQHRIGCRHNAFQLDAAIRAAGEEEIHHAQQRAVVVRRDQGEPVPAGEQVLGGVG